MHGPLRLHIQDQFPSPPKKCCPLAVLRPRPEHSPLWVDGPQQALEGILGELDTWNVVGRGSRSTCPLMPQIAYSMGSMLEEFLRYSL